MRSSGAALRQQQQPARCHRRNAHQHHPTQAGTGTEFTITGLNVPVLSVHATQISDNDLQGLFNTLLTGNDTIIGSSGNDTLVASGPNDSLAGNGGTDVLTGLAGGDTTAVVGLARREATVAFSGSSGIVTGAGIADTLSAIERIRFVDGTLAYGADSPEAQAARLYQAAFGRAPDASGTRSYWAGVAAGWRVARRPRRRVPRQSRVPGALRHPRQCGVRERAVPECAGPAGGRDRRRLLDQGTRLRDDAGAGARVVLRKPREPDRHRAAAGERALVARPERGVGGAAAITRPSTARRMPPD